MTANKTLTSVRIPEQQFPRIHTALLQRKCACGSKVVSEDQCDDCRKTELQRKANRPSELDEVPPIVYDVLRSPGYPLDAKTRAFMEPQFGHDFSQVRVHTDSWASRSAAMIDALAYTVGSDVVFADGQYHPSTDSGAKLLAHELTHVVQQSTAETNGPLHIGPLDDEMEHEANQIADRDDSRSSQSQTAFSTLKTKQVQRDCGPTPTGPFPGDSIDPPGKCPDRYALLKQEVVKACGKDTDGKSVVSETGCNFSNLHTKQGAWEALKEIGLRLTSLVKCYMARWNIMVKCFKGGSEGHRIAIHEICKAIEKCYRQLQIAVNTLTKHAVPQSEIFKWLLIAGISFAVAALIISSWGLSVAAFVSALLVLFGARLAFAGAD
jgi:hypothetical protein